MTHIARPTGMTGAAFTSFLAGLAVGTVLGATAAVMIIAVTSR